MKRLVFKVLIGVLAGTSFSAAAHHSFAALYDIDREISIEGRVVLFAVRNPHSFLHVVAVDENGAELRWAVEWGAAATLGQVRDILKPGDEVIVVGNPGRNPEARAMKIKSIERLADGWFWSGEVE